uniref:Uncharacterized protein n=1 Tax=Alexandrium monilatum TaxID=311494 RepID=A0A7S4VG20_9DINO
MLSPCPWTTLGLSALATPTRTALKEAWICRSCCSGATRQARRRALRGPSPRAPRCSGASPRLQLCQPRTAPAARGREALPSGRRSRPLWRGSRSLPRAQNLRGGTTCWSCWWAWQRSRRPLRSLGSRRPSSSPTSWRPATVVDGTDALAAAPSVARLVALAQPPVGPFVREALRKGGPGVDLDGMLAGVSKQIDFELGMLDKAPGKDGSLSGELEQAMEQALGRPEGGVNLQEMKRDRITMVAHLVARVRELLAGAAA